MQEWNAIDLHMHTCVGITGDGGFDVIKNFTYSNYVCALNENNIKLAAITNHNIINMKNYIICRYLGKKKGINILFGVELDSCTEDGKNFHSVVIFNESFNNCVEIANYINLNTDRKKKQDGIVRYTSDEIISLIGKYDAIIIPHGDKSKGIYEEPSEFAIKEALKKVKDGFIRVFDCKPSDWKMSKIKQYLDSNNMIENLDDFGGVLFSDNRDWKKYVNKEFYMNAEATFRGFIHSITNPVYRFAKKEMIPCNSHYISKIEFKSKNKDSRIVDGCINLKSGYNCIIGKSGSGKSLLRYLISNGLISNFDSKEYSFSQNTKVTFYDENDNEIKQGTINIAIGKSIFERIISASESKDSSNMYNVIKLLDSSFKEKVNFSSFISSYKQQMKKYSMLKNQINLDEKELQEIINSFNSDNQELLNLKNIKVFEFDIPSDFEYKYSDSQLENIRKIYNQLKQLKLSTEYFEESVKIELIKKIKEYWKIYFKEYKRILLENTKQKYMNFKKKLVRLALGNVNKCISNNAQKKTNLINQMPENIKGIVKKSIKMFLSKQKIKLFDFSIKKEKIDSKIELIKGNGIIITEEINSKLIKSMNEKDNSFFYTYKHKQELLNNVIDMSDTTSANNLIEKYYNTNLLTEENISKSFTENVIDVNVYFDNQNVKELNPGDIAKKYIKLYFSKLADGKNSIILYDQIENDVDKQFINETILPLINDIRFKAQIIIITHDPIVAVNADPVNYIQSIKDKNGLITYRSFVPESEINDELNTIAKIVDGSKNVIKQRYEVYKGENEYGD